MRAVGRTDKQTDRQTGEQLRAAAAAKISQEQREKSKSASWADSFLSTYRLLLITGNLLGAEKAITYVLVHLRKMPVRFFLLHNVQDISS